jgi:hypothetical protein
MDIDMRQKQRHTARTWTWTCSINRDMNNQRGQKHAAWTRTCSLDMNMQRGHEHAAWKITCSMNLDVDTDMGTGMDMDIIKYIAQRNIFCGDNGHCRIHLI